MEKTRIESIDFTPHSTKQDQAIWSPAPITVCGTGIQWGKTRVGAVRSAIRQHEYTDPNDNFLVCAPTYKILQQSTLPAYMRLMEGRGHLSKQDWMFDIYGGGKCWFRTATDPDSIVGITDVRHVWIDEADKVSLYFWENAQARAAFRNAQIDLTTSPYSLGWLYKEIVLPKNKNPGARPDVMLIQARSDENPYFPKAVFEARKQTTDPKRFRMIYGGCWEKPEGLVYGCFDEAENICEPFSFPSGTRFFAGVDWGSTHPFVIVVRAVTPNGNHYQVAEFYQGSMTSSGRIEAARQKMSVWGIELFACGPDRPDNIAEFCQAGIPAVAADNAVKKGIEKHYELIASRRYKVFRGSSPKTCDEYEKYHWPSEEELDEDQDSKDPNPVKQNDDAMDANRYVTMLALKMGGEKRRPKAKLDQKKETHQDLNRGLPIGKKRNRAEAV